MVFSKAIRFTFLAVATIIPIIILVGNEDREEEKETVEAARSSTTSDSTLLDQRRSEACRLTDDSTITNEDNDNVEDDITDTSSPNDESIPFARLPESTFNGPKRLCATTRKSARSRQSAFIFAEHNDIKEYICRYEENINILCTIAEKIGMEEVLEMFHTKSALIDQSKQLARRIGGKLYELEVFLKDIPTSDATRSSRYTQYELNRSYTSCLRKFMKLEEDAAQKRAHLQTETDADADVERRQDASE